MNTEQLKEIIISQKEDFLNLSSLMERDALNKVKEFKNLPHIIVIKGLRRSGKSVFLSQINNLLYKRKNAYVNFDDERLITFNIGEFEKLYETFLSLNEDKVYFLDEIQNLKDWERPIRRLYDKKIKFYLTGSNASLLSKELGTKLTGRNIQIEIYPFSFKEFLKISNFKLNKDSFYLTKEKSKIKSLFNEYFSDGGMPEYIQYNKKEIIQQVYEDILLKDIFVRYNLDNDKQLRLLTKYLLTNVGVLFSYNSLKKLLGFGSVNTVMKYISYLENAYLLFELEKYEFSLKKQIQQNKKIYAIDVSFINLISFKFSENKGRLLENLVFIELKRRGKEIYYHRAKKECDFLIKQGLDIVDAIQVCYNLDEDNKKREFSGLIEACKIYNLKECLLLTYDYEDELILEDVKIVIKPVWKWLLTFVNN